MSRFFRCSTFNQNSSKLSNFVNNRRTHTHMLTHAHTHTHTQITLQKAIKEGGPFICIGRQKFQLWRVSNADFLTPVLRNLNFVLHYLILQALNFSMTKENAQMWKYECTVSEGLLTNWQLVKWSGNTQFSKIVLLRYLATILLCSVFLQQEISFGKTECLCSGEVIVSHLHVNTLFPSLVSWILIDWFEESYSTKCFKDNHYDIE